MIENKRQTWQDYTNKAVFYTAIAVFASIIIGGFSVIVDTEFFSGDVTETQSSNILASGSIFDPLQGNEQCEKSFTKELKIKGGSGFYNYRFTGNGIDSKYGTLTDGTQSVSTVNQNLATASTSISYIAPKSNEITKLGQVLVEAEDTLAIDNAGNKQKVTFTINIKPSCIQKLEFTEPKEDAEQTIQKGIAFELKQIKADLYNKDNVSYILPNDKFKFAVNPENSGTFDSGKFFYTTLTNGNTTRIVSYIPTGDLGVPKPANENDSTLVGTKPVIFKVGSQVCDLSAQFYIGKGAGFNPNNPTDKTPLPRQSALHSGENIVLFSEGGRGPYKFSTSSTDILTVTAYNSNPTTPPPNTPPPTVESEFAVVKAIKAGVATIFITDKNQCTAILTVYVDNFPPVIEYIKLDNINGITQGATKKLFAKVSDLDTIQDVYETEVKIYKGYFALPENIPESASPILIINNQNDTTTTTQDTTNSSGNKVFTKLFEIPIKIPVRNDITNGYYTVLFTVTDKRPRDYGYNKAEKTTPILIGSSLDVTDDGKMDEMDIILGLRGLTQGNSNVSFTDLIMLLKIINNNK